LNLEIGSQFAPVLAAINLSLQHPEARKPGLNGERADDLAQTIDLTARLW
jgi:hypothetical protein